MVVQTAQPESTAPYTLWHLVRYMLGLGTWELEGSVATGSDDVARALDHLLLDAAEVREAEAVVENLMRVGHSAPYSRPVGDAQAWRWPSALPWGRQ